MVTIKNDYLIVEIHTLGAQLQSIKDAKGVEYLWQGDARYWSGRATNIFPFVGRLEGATYVLDGVSYPMGSHGFARDSEFVVGEYSEQRVELILESDKNLQAIYPFYFTFTITYELQKDQIFISFKVVNKGQNTMYCALGGHPGFNIPIANQGEFHDYYLEFDEPCMPTRMSVSKKGLMDGCSKAHELIDYKIMKLNHNLYRDDAVILKDTSKSLTIKNNIGAPEIQVGFPKMKYIATWKPAITEAQFLCIEPWTTLPGRDAVVEDIADFVDMNHIQGGHTYENKWWIKIIN